MDDQREVMEVEIGGNAVQLPYPVLQVEEGNGVTYVLLDPDRYVARPEYREASRNGGLAIRNLIAYDNAGKRLWDAEFPDQRDYYYKIASANPLIAYSFSSFRCEIDARTGKIIQKEFYK